MKLIIKPTSPLTTNLPGIPPTETGELKANCGTGIIFQFISVASFYYYKKKDSEIPLGFKSMQKTSGFCSALLCQDGGTVEALLTSCTRTKNRSAMECRIFWGNCTNKQTGV